ncbi:MAG: tetratricopeptide repeat protein [Endozoicomonadaceae bacterium]|nr:tetratricopeptide repeat protein [Endozoicomonadaceae bacterium]
MPPDVVKKHIYLASQYFQSGQTAEAISRLHIAISLTSIPEILSQAHGLLGVIYQYQQEYTAARIEFKKALEYDGHNSEVRNNYGSLLYEKKQYAAAADQFKLVAADLTYRLREQAFENLGTAYLQMGYKKLGQEAYESAVRLKVQTPIANFKLAMLSFEDNDIETANRYYQVFAEYGHQTAASLLLGIRIARKRNNEIEKSDQYATRLAIEFHDSNEYQLYLYSKSK